MSQKEFAGIFPYLVTPMLMELAEEPNIRYLKDASGNTGKLLSIVNALKHRIKIFSASAHIPVFVFMMGGVGWMAGPACLIRSSVLPCLVWREKKMGGGI